MAQAEAVVIDLGEFRRRRQATRQGSPAPAWLPQQMPMPVVTWFAVPVWVVTPFWHAM